jgi:hypothetical protein
MKGFSDRWCSWVNEFVNRGSVAIKVNDDVSRYFQTKKGLRQGDTLSPLLFSMVINMLATFISRVREEDQIDGLLPHLVDRGLSVLQFANDTILLTDHNLEQAKNMKLLLCVFQKLPGLKINFHKSELFYGDAKNHEEEYT